MADPPRQDAAGAAAPVLARGDSRHFGDLMSAGMGAFAREAQPVAAGGGGDAEPAAVDGPDGRAAGEAYKGLARSCVSENFGAGSPYLPAEAARKLAPLERVLATANGNLQRIVSSWCNRSVRVKVVRNESNASASSSEMVSYDRSVELWCEDRKFGVADSTVTLQSPRLIEAVSSGRVGIGQLFRQFDLLPAFELLAVSALDDDKIDRLYTLKAAGILCEIREVLDARAIPAPTRPVESKEGEPLETASRPGSAAERATKAGGADGADPAASEVPKVPNHYGDLMAGTDTSVNVHDGRFKPFERVLLTANGNVQRLLSSFLNEPIAVNVLVAGTPDADPAAGFAASFRRHAQLCSARGVLLCDASSTVRVASRDLAETVAKGIRDLGAVFGAPGTANARMPHFELISARRLSGDDGFSLSRSYELSTDEASVLVTERFHKSLFEHDTFM